MKLTMASYIDIDVAAFTRSAETELGSTGDDGEERQSIVEGLRFEGEDSSIRRDAS